MARSRKKRVSGATLFFFLLSVVLAVLLYRSVNRGSGTAPAHSPAPGPGRATPARPQPSARSSRPGARAERPAPSSSSLEARPSPESRSGEQAERRPSPREGGASIPTIAILIDDLGNDRAAAARIAQWPFAVSGAVLPDLPASAETAFALARSGKDVLLHLPMEPKGYPGVRPGPGVILISQSDEQIASTLQSDLETVPGAIGVNNHMGSAATADPRVMRAVAAVLARRGLFFIDSRTTQATVALDAVKQAGVRSASRRVFLDDVASESAIEASLGELIAKAREGGSAIAIGHPYPATLAVLDRELPRLAERGVRLVRVRDLVE